MYNDETLRLIESLHLERLDIGNDIVGLEAEAGCRGTIETSAHEFCDTLGYVSCWSIALGR